MATDFFFYDLETSGFNPKEARIMQFAGQRTNLDLELLGEPIDKLIKMTPDILPDPDAVLLTGITPQATLKDGLSEREFLRQFEISATLPDTIFVGYNNIRFDDEFMRYLHYRNYFDPYEWQWQAGRSRWDLLDVVRMTRALRPSGVKWPLTADGKPTNRLELLTTNNGLDHQQAHNALNDVLATIAVAKMIRDCQTKLFDYLLQLRNKKQVAKLVLSGEPFIYTSGKYPGEFEKTTVAVSLVEHPNRPGALVYDLRFDPTLFQDLSAKELADVWHWQREPVSPRLPIKSLRFNCCPAVAPMGVLDKASQQRLKIDTKQIKSHYLKLKKIQANFIPKLLTALDILNDEQQSRLSLTISNIDGQLYDDFFKDNDKQVMKEIQKTTAIELRSDKFSFNDQRLRELLSRYKARNFPNSLTETEQKQWENYRRIKLLDGGENSYLARYINRLKVISGQANLSAHDRYLIEELQLYGQSIIPVETADVA